MPVPTLVTDLSTTLASNSPAGSDNVFPDLDNYLRALSGFVASIRDNSGNGWVSPYLPLAGGTVTGATIFSSTVALNGALSGTGLTTYLASPPAIGGTTPAAGSFTTLAASGNVTLSGGTANGVLYLNGSKVATSGSGLVFDGTNLGLGVTPSAWSATYKAIQFPSGTYGGGSFITDAGSPAITANAYNNAGWKYVNNDYATIYQSRSGQHQWFTAPSGTAGNTISFTQALTLDANRNLLLNGTTAGASAVGTLAIFNGTAPTGSVTDGIILYAEDVSSSSELKVRDEAGNVTTLSPHNFSLIPEGPSEDMAWAYYSEKGGKRINVDMLKLARMVEKLTGEKLVYEV